MNEIMVRYCKKHKRTDYVFIKRTWFCKKCRAEKTIENRRKVKKMAVDFKGGKCEICGYKKCISALEFHHVDRSTKEYGISGKSWEKTKSEIEKCILVCSNCHREIHHAKGGNRK